MTELFEPNLEEWKELQYQLNELLERQKQLLKEQEKDIL